VAEQEQPKEEEQQLTPEQKKEALRQELLTKEYNAYAEGEIIHSASLLTSDEKKMLGHLLEAARLIEELHMLQIHPENLTMRDKIMQSGTEIEKKVFMRYQRPWCGDDETPECIALKDAPPKNIGLSLWPANLTDGQFESLSSQINAKELLSPFTVVHQNKDGSFGAIAYGKSEIFQEKMKQVADSLRAAAKLAPHKTLAKFLNSRAVAFESADPFPYDASDYDWIALSGDWEVTVGPYEVYEDPRKVKAFFQMYIGKEDKELNAELSRFRENLQEMENRVGELVGKEIYRSRKLDPRISIRAVDIWMAAGAGRRDRGVVAAFHLPNRGKSVDEGLYKKVMMVNHSMVFKPIVAARAELILAPEQIPFVDIRANITNVAFHEFAHGFGAYHEMKVKNPKGKTVTVQQAFGENESLLEELKADVLGMWLIQYQKEEGWLTEEDVKKRYTSQLMHMLGLLQYPLSGVYPRMEAIAVGTYLDAGAVVWDKENEKFRIDFEKLPGAVESLARKIATIQLTGDEEEAEALIDKYIFKTGDKEYSLKGMLGQVRAVMVEKFRSAGIKSPSLRYVVNDLAEKGSANEAAAAAR